MSDRPPAPPVRPLVALGLCTVGFFALLVAGLGVASLATDADVISVHGLGQVPGVVGIVAACGAFAAGLWSAIRRSRASFWSVPITAAATYLGYVFVTGIAATAVSSDLGVGLAVAGELAAGWQGGVVATASLIAGAAGVALARARGPRPRWPWEGDDEE